MPQLERWDRLPEGVRRHLIERMRDRAIGSLKICGSGSYPKTFLLRGQVAKGEAV
jgi:hypothetical protein